MEGKDMNISLSGCGLGEGTESVEPSKRKTIAPAILGVASSHGVKLSMSMTSQDKKELLDKLEEWRKARKEKFAAKILAKQKQVDKTKTFPMLPSKDGLSTSSLSKGDSGGTKSQDRESVFERLYKNSSKAKKQETTIVPSAKPMQIKSKIQKGRMSLNSQVKLTKSHKPVKSITAAPLKINETFPSKILLPLEKVEEVEVEIETDKVVPGTKIGNNEPKSQNAATEIENVSENLGHEIKFTELKIEIPEDEILEEKVEDLNRETNEKPENVVSDLLEVKLKEEIVPKEGGQPSVFVAEDFKKEETDKIEVAKQSNASVVEDFEKDESDDNSGKADASEQPNIWVAEGFEKNEILNDNIGKIEEKDVLEESMLQSKQKSPIKKNRLPNQSKLVSVPQKKTIQKPIIFSIPKKYEARRYKSTITPSCKKSLIKPHVTKPDDNPKPKLRRSISMLFRRKNSTISAIHRTASETNLNKLEKVNGGGKIGVKPLLTPPQESEGVKCITPTSLTTTPKRTKILTSTSLRNNLADWLKSNNYSLENYRHLRCFGISATAKPLPQPSVTTSDSTPETSRHSTPPTTPVDESDKENSTPPTVIQKIDESEVENWLRELHGLIVDLKYPGERCEEWLAAIRKKCATCSKMPIYWECLAALNEFYGNVKGAVESYEKVIAKGKDVTSTDDSLADLFDKMLIDQHKQSKGKLDKGLDPKNIFKSTVIKFALQQKPLKETTTNEDYVRKQYVVTPVRRSSRIQTPQKHLTVNSLQTLTDDIKNNTTFKPNESLLNN